jgi:L-asparaginase
LTGEVNRTLARPEVAGVIISHGTDTLEETAYWLDLTTNSEKPIVLIGAQRNASEPDFDGPRNLLNAVRICVDPQSKGKGAMLAMNNQINAARDVTKTHTSSVETFKSGDFGVLGIVDYDRVVFSRAPLRRQYVPIKTDVMPYVEIVAMYGGADGHLVRAAVDHGAKGIVIQGLALLWQIFSGTGFPNQFFNDSWVVGFWRADHGRHNVELGRRASRMAQAILGSPGP